MTLNPKPRAIPGKVIEYLEPERILAIIDVGGVRARVDMRLLADDPPHVGDWVLLHVGFAMSKIEEAEALDQIRLLETLGEGPLALEEVRGCGLEDARSENST